jgi:hypothetical protein
MLSSSAECSFQRIMVPVIRLLNCHVAGHLAMPPKGGHATTKRFKGRTGLGRLKHGVHDSSLGVWTLGSAAIRPR